MNVWREQVDSTVLLKISVFAHKYIRLGDVAMVELSRGSPG